MDTNWVILKEGRAVPGRSTVQRASRAKPLDFGCPGSISHDNNAELSASLYFASVTQSTLQELQFIS